MIAQAAGCGPVATAFADGQDVCRPVRPDTIAKSLAIGNPADGPYALELARETGGSIQSVSDDEIRAGIRLLAETIERKKLRTRVLAANIQDTDQLWQVYRAGAHCATLNPRLLEQALQEPAIPPAVRFFDDAWKEAFGEIRLTDCR